MLIATHLQLLVGHEPAILTLLPPMLASGLIKKKRHQMMPR